MTGLRLSPNLTLAEDAFFQAWGILAMRGAGKTNAAAVMAEELYAAGRPFVVVDPVGSWWGLRADASGKPGGLAIPIFGGDHGDLPLEETAGHVIADFLIEERASCVIDASTLSESAKHRFLAEFADRLLRKNTEPLVVILEEADDYAPQRVTTKGPAAVTLGRMQALVKRGRFKGLTPVMVTQRSAAINKDLLTQIDNLVVLRMTSPQDRKAIEGWVDTHGQSRELLNSLPELEDGEAWLWSPHALKLFKRFRFRRRTTYDSGATPKGGTARKAATLADVDLGALSERMAATIQRAKAEDPRELKRELADLRRQIRTQAPAVQVQEVVREVEIPIEVSVLTDDDRIVLKELLGGMDRLGARLSTLLALPGYAPPVTLRAGRSDRKAEPAARPRLEPRPTPRQAVIPSAPDDLSAYAGGLLKAVARRHPMRLTRGQVALFAGRSPRSSAFGPALGELVRAGYLEQDGSRFALTPLGAEVAGVVEEPPETPQELQAFWLSKLPAYEASILRVLIDLGGAWLTREEIAERSGRSITSSAFGPAINNLVELQLAEREGTSVRATETIL